jgi:magnesium and cobalt transporter
MFHLEIRNKEDLQHKFKQSLKNNVINPEAYGILENTLNLSDLQVRDIMMPKGQMVYIPEHASYPEIVTRITESGHSRFPVMADHSDEILGILHAKDLLTLSDEEKQDLDLANLIRTANFVPESKHLDALLADFRQNRNHMVIVVNEYGQTIGFVTLEDTIEQILGDIADEFDVDKEDPIKLISAKLYILRGDTELELFNHRLGTQLDDSHFDTIGGLLTAQFGYTPKRGEKISYEHFKFKILNANSRRIKLIECLDRRPEPNPMDS